MRTIQDIMRLSPQDRKELYTAEHIGYIKIDNNRFDNYGTYSFIWEKSYIKSPVRSGDGSIGNLDSYSTFLTGHLRIDFSLMSIDYYRKLMQLLYASNEHIVECYDIVNDRTITLKMYFSTEEMPKIHTIAHQIQKSADEWEEWVELVGVQGYTVEMVGTNAPLDTVSVTYWLNPPNGTGDQMVYGEDVSMGQEIVVGYGADIQDQKFIVVENGITKVYEFAYWKDRLTETIYSDNFAITINKPLRLEAIWQVAETTSFTLSYNYGIGEVQKNENGQDKYSKQISYGAAIGELPTSPLPTVKFLEKEYTPYTNKGWYFTPQISTNSIEITSNTIYNVSGNATIYQIIDPINYGITFISDEKYIGYVEQPYNSNVYTPYLVKDGYKLVGWYYDSEYTVKFENKMPPFSCRIYAKWELSE